MTSVTPYDIWDHRKQKVWYSMRPIYIPSMGVLNVDVSLKNIQGLPSFTSGDLR